jgi:hypothetical protein
VVPLLPKPVSLAVLAVLAVHVNVHVQVHVHVGTGWLLDLRYIGEARMKAVLLGTASRSQSVM